MVIIADDLTGANDTGLQFARKGLPTEVILAASSIKAATDRTVVVIDTNSRALAPDEAYRRVGAAAQQAHSAGFSHYYKKVDSTLRGNIGIELRAILALGIHDFAFVMPAYPQNGRTTVGGHHLLHGIPLAATEIAQDPKYPVTETVLPSLLTAQTGSAVGHIGIAELCQGEAAIVSAISNYLEKGCQIISSDAWLDDHFPLAVRAVNQLGRRVLWSGSAGLAGCLPEILGLTEKTASCHKPSLVVAGSVSAVTREQVRRLLAVGYKLVEVEIVQFPWQQDQFAACLQQTAAYLGQGDNVVLASGFSGKAMEATKQAGLQYGLSLPETSEIVAQILGWLGATVVNEQEIGYIVLTGGDTAVAVCQALGVSGIRIVEELAPAIPLGEMKTAAGKTVRVITKAGAFGDADCLVKALNHVQRR